MKKNRMKFAYINVCVCNWLLFYCYLLYLYRSVCISFQAYTIGTKFGTHMQIHLEKVVGKLKFARVT